MTPNEINKRIAIACGWIEHELGDGGMYGWTAPNGEYRTSCLRPYYYEDELPNYHGDLNAMHEAEKVLDRGENHLMRGGFGLYLINLPRVCDGEPRVCATAAQRAEAFLRTIGQWEETE